MVVGGGGHGLDTQGVKKRVPIINDSADSRYPILGSSFQPRGGTARHDAVAWGFARGADARGVDIIQQCEVTGIRRDSERVTGVETSKGFIGAKKVAVVEPAQPRVQSNVTLLSRSASA